MVYGNVLPTFWNVIMQILKYSSFAEAITEVLDREYYELDRYVTYVYRMLWLLQLQTFTHMQSLETVVK